MKPERVVLIELAMLAVGFGAVVVALAAVDWRIGLFVFGLGFIVASIDTGRLR